MTLEDERLRAAVGRLLAAADHLEAQIEELTRVLRAATEALENSRALAERMQDVNQSEVSTCH
jgi:hypothetical protein